MNMEYCGTAVDNGNSEIMGNDYFLYGDLLESKYCLTANTTTNSKKKDKT